MKRGDWTFRAFLDGRFRLDGGSMFGVVPRVLWERQHEPDGLNRIELALRCLFAESGERRVLVDVGIGDRWEEKQRAIYAIDRRPGQLLQELGEAGIAPESITDVVLTHLHFDHCGGALRDGPGGPVPCFPNARHWVQLRHWNWAKQPTERDRASFRSADFLPLETAGLLQVVDGAQEIIPGVRVVPVSGHTPHQQMVEFDAPEGGVVFCADLLPFASHLRIPWIMGFDLNPLLTLNEKREFLSRAAEEQTTLVFEHDPAVEACGVTFTDKGFEPVGPFTLAER
jgi:glyoxylase-like metal-dependent hydrolase (beta-lactamase superfamily II)